MSAPTVTQIAVLLAVGLVWLGVNLKAGSTWLKFITLTAMLGFLGAASALALVAIFGGAR